jgi:choline dehydrogenase-like flavoprotein
VLIDLQQQQNRQVRVYADVCIIGSGVAGLLLAHQLLGKGRRVVVLETGGREAGDETHPLNEVVQRGSVYRGATHGRARCVGGTSTRWGGAMIPFLPSDLAERSHVGAPQWPVSFQELSRFIPDVERVFALDRGSYDGAFLSEFGDAAILPQDPDFLPRFAKWPRFRMRNLANLFRREIEQDNELQLWFNAHVTSFALDEGGDRIASVTASAHSERLIEVSANRFVLCAGAIESTRLLLSLDRQAGGRLSRQGGALGRFFHDHVSIVAADLEVDDPFSLNRLAGLRFVGSTMRSLRFELSPAAQAAERVSSAFGHIQFATREATTFDAIRELLQCVQKRARPRWSSVTRVVFGAPDLAMIAYWRAKWRQLRWPRAADYQFHIVAEQLPSRDNQISLAGDVDRFGVPLASINWRVQPRELATVEAYARRFESFWRRRGLARVARLNWRDLPRRIADESSPMDVFHPGGSTRMGTSASVGVVDRDLKVFGFGNLHVASTSVFPSGASANPTFMLMLFVCRLSRHLLDGALARDVAAPSLP